MFFKSYPTRFEQGPLRIILFLFIAQLAITLLTDGQVLSFDEAMWQYIGRNWFRHGLVPYAGGVDNKSPLIFAIYGLSDRLFGVNYWFPRLLGTIVQTLGIYFLYKIAIGIGGRRAGIFALSIYGLSLLWRSTDGKLVSLTETYANTLIIISIYRWLASSKNRDFFISGFIAGFGAGFRLSAFFGIAALLISSFRVSWLAVASFLLGVLSSILLLISLAYLGGINLHDFYEYGFVDNFGPGSPTDHHILWKLENFVNGFFYSELILFYPGMIGYFLLKKRITILTAWLICVFIGINIIGIYARPHFKDILPVLSLMSALSIAHLTKTYTIPTRPILLIVWFVFFPKIIEPLVSLKKFIFRPADPAETYCKAPFFQPDDYAKKKLGIWIRSNTTEGEKVLVAGYGAIVQAYTERVSSSIYFNATQTDKAKQKFKEELGLHPPKLLAIPLFAEYGQNVDQDLRAFMVELILKRYYFDKCLYGYSVYRLKQDKDLPGN
jgi:Dolichyl-phosphate-mannose-protein mannosyltransferase